MALAKQIDRLMSFLGFGQSTEPQMFDLRLERCRQREARRVTQLGLFRKSPKLRAASAR